MESRSPSLGRSLTLICTEISIATERQCKKAHPYPIDEYFCRCDVSIRIPVDGLLPCHLATTSQADGRPEGDADGEYLLFV